MNGENRTAKAEGIGPESELPAPLAVPARRFSALWILPLMALVAGGWLAVTVWQARGVEIRIRFEEGHGLKIDDPVRYRGIVVGTVHDLSLDRDLDHVEVTLRIERRSDRIARSSTRFWIVRPELGIDRITGLETLIGPRYIAVEPGSAAGVPRTSFVGLDEPPVEVDREPGDLEILLHSRTRGSLRAQSPVTYRDLQVGVVLSVGLTSDGSAVEARVLVEKPFRELIRTGTRFWDSGGMEAELGIGGLSVRLESLERLFLGSVALVVPPADRAGSMVHTGHRFVLADRPEEEWFEWRPTLLIGSHLLPQGLPLPHPVWGRLGWRRGFLRGIKTYEGWLLPTEIGLLGPANLLVADAKAELDSVNLEVAGQSVSVSEQPRDFGEGIALRPLPFDTPFSFPESLLRSPEGPEDCIAIGDPGDSPLSLTSSRLDPQGRSWVVDAALSLGPRWHGASVVSRADGSLVGLLLIEPDAARVALLPERDVNR